MAIIIPGVFIVVAFGLFWAVKSKKISSQSLQDTVNFLAIVSAITGGILFLVPILFPTLATSDLEISSPNTPTHESVITPTANTIPTLVTIYPTNTTLKLTETATAQPTLKPEPLQSESAQTGNNISLTYEGVLYENEVIVGYADKFQNNSSCIVFIVTGPQYYKFSIESGIWFKWVNTPIEYQDTLIQDQKNTLIQYCDANSIKTIRYSAPSNNNTPANTSGETVVCQEAAFDNNLRTNNPLFKSPDGYSFGWISADKAKITLPNQIAIPIETQFVAVVENLSFIEINDLAIDKDGFSKASGCWYKLNNFFEQKAKEEFCKKRLNDNKVAYYKLTSAGILELSKEPNFSCP